MKPTASQKFNFSAICVLRGSLPCVFPSRPKRALPNDVFAKPNHGVLKVLNALWSAEIPFSRPIMPNQALEALAFNMLGTGGQRFLTSRNEICQAIGNHWIKAGYSICGRQDFVAVECAE